MCSPGHYRCQRPRHVNQQRVMRQRRLGTAVDPDKTCLYLGTPFYAKRKGASANLKRNDVSRWILMIWLAEWLSRDVLIVTSALVAVWLFQVFGHRCQDRMLVGDQKGKGDYLRRRGVRRASSHTLPAPSYALRRSPRTLSVLSSVWSPTQDSVSLFSQWIIGIICLVCSSV